MMNRKMRLWHHDADDDPLGGLVNLFDLWIVVVVALVLMLIQAKDRTADSQPAMMQSASTVEQQAQDLIPMERFRPSDKQLSGKGTRLGTAYRLANGEVVYVPE